MNSPIAPAYDLYHDAKQRNPILTPEQERSLLARIQRNANDEEAQECLIRANIGLINHAVRTFAGAIRSQGIDPEDLKQEACLGLIHAAQRFDLTSPGKLSTYAMWSIRQAISHSIEWNGNGIRLPTYQQKLVRYLKARDCSHSNGIVDERQEESNQQTLALVQRAMRAVVSLDAPLREAEDITLADTLTDPTEATEETALRTVVQEEVDATLRLLLTEREWRMLRLRYGLFSDHDHTFEQIAHQEHLTKERVRQILKGAIAKLQQSPLTHFLFASFY